jgi:hypothetical protein
MTAWIERTIHRYERMRFNQEPNRHKAPFEWGFEYIGGQAGENEPRKFLAQFVVEAIAHSDEWFVGTPAEDYAFEDGVLTFTSAIASPWAANNRVHAQVFQAKRKSGPAVAVLSQWNARWDEQQGVCRWLNQLGITAVKVSLPYHDRRAAPGHPRADYLVSPNIGLTLQANRQAVSDVRRVLRWLEQQGYERLGILGTSIGSCIGFITLCHEQTLRAGAFLHVSRYFGDVVARGLTTENVWESLAEGVTADELRLYWSPISPSPYIGKLCGAGKKILMITGRYDPTFLPELTEAIFHEIRTARVEFAKMSLPCGHYSLGVAPFRQIAGYRFGKFLQRELGA